jgi:hypothetical protein
LEKCSVVKSSDDTTIPKVRMLTNDGYIFSQYNFYEQSQTFKGLPLIDILMFLRSLTGYFWIKAYYIKALWALRLENRPQAKKYIIFALDYYMSKQKYDSVEQLTAFILKEGLSK